MNPCLGRVSMNNPGYTRVRTILSPRMLTSSGVKGRGGGPETLTARVSYVPLWHAHQMSDRSPRYWTVQSRGVQLVDKARSSPEALRNRSTGLPPTGTIFPEFGAMSAGLTSSSNSESEGSGVFGEIRRAAWRGRV